MGEYIATFAQAGKTRRRGKLLKHHSKNLNQKMPCQASAFSGHPLTKTLDERCFSYFAWCSRKKAPSGAPLKGRWDKSHPTPFA